MIILDIFKGNLKFEKFISITKNVLSRKLKSLKYRFLIKIEFY